MTTTMSSKNRPSNPLEFWDERRGTIYSRKGGAVFAQGVVFSHGYSILDELVGNISYTQMMVLNATGKLPDPRVAAWIEAAYICLSWPDPRIWCNQIGALSGTLRTTAVAATAAGMLAADSTMYGTLPLIEGVAFIQHALKDKRNGSTAPEIVDRACARYRGKPNIVGYARPIARGDERVVALEKVTEALQFDVGDHLSLAYEIQDILLERFGETMNINGYASAFLSDQGYTADEIYQFSAMCVNSGVTASYLGTQEQPPESFLPLRCDDIDYQGKSPRAVPDSD